MSHIHTHSLNDQEPDLFLDAVKILVKSMHSSLRLTTVLLCEEKGQVSWDVGNSSV